jgi:hypothetical protein
MIVTGTPAVRSAARELLAPPLTGGARVDVCIVGAGLAGMVAAYLLAREKRSVMVVDEGPIGALAGGAEVAHLGAMVDPPFAQIERVHGESGARIAAQGATAAIDMLQSIIRRERIACEFERLEGFAFTAAGMPRHAIDHEVEAARRAGLREAEAAALPPAAGGEPQSGVRYPGHAHFHPHKLLAGLARAITREGGRIHCGVRTRPLAPDRASTLVTAAGHRIEADAVISQSLREAGPRIAHAVGLRMPRGSLAPALYWEASGPARCARLRTLGTGAGEVLLVAGEEQPAILESWARRRFPFAGDVAQRFTCERPRAADLFAFTGRSGADSDSVFVSASSWGNHATRAMIAGMVARDFVLGSRSPGDLYMPTA